MRTLKNILAGTAVATVLAALPLSTSVAGFDEGLQAYQAGNYKTAFEEWKPLAEQNNLAAMRNIGLMYKKGLGVEPDPKKAFSWYSRAAELGFDRAQANVAAMYMKGDGVQQDYVKAAEWFTRAAQQGHVISQYNLGLMYELGRGVERSQSKALAWYNLAAEANHPGALKRMSALVAKNPDIKDESAAVASAPKAPVTPAPVVEPAPAPTQAPKVTEAPQPAPKLETPKTVAAAPNVTSSAAPAKKFDPFANSANNAALRGEAASAPKEATGAPTAFNQPKAVETPKRVIVEPPKPAAEVIKPTPQPVAEPVVQPKVAEAPETPAKPVAEPEVSAAPTEKAVVAPASEPASQVAENRPASLPKKEESKGFFSSLKSLILGSDEEEDTEIGGEATSTTATVVANAPTPAVPTAAPSAEPVQVVTGSALSIPERLEMAALSYELKEYQQALSVWAPLAQEGNATAQYQLGNMFNTGIAVPVDRIRAYYWWQKASAGGSQEAAAALSKLEGTLTFLEKKQLQNVN
ncbi:MAG: SEL1-like repeat protein [Sneathiella sp.]|nr:SEL1-like repeat protein [Sneathiella sp.]